jgi:hypothetical protein
VVVVVTVVETVTGIFITAALFSLFVLFAKTETTVLRVGATVTVHSLPETRVPCERVPSVIANTKVVCGVVRTVNVTVSPEETVVLSNERFVNAGAADTVSGITIINKNAITNVFTLTFKIHHLLF